MNIKLLKNATKVKKLSVDVVKIKEVELDEMWSFVKNKTKQRWLWYAIEHKTGKILSYTFGKRKNYVFLKLRKLLEPFKVEMNYTDNWISYSKYIDKNKHKIGKINTQKHRKKKLKF